jgi:hypothetical protein
MKSIKRAIAWILVVMAIGLTVLADAITNLARKVAPPSDDDGSPTK